MIQNQDLIPDFISKLYALPKQYELIPLVEDENGDVNHQPGGVFQYRVARKVVGINELRNTLNNLKLEVIPVEKTKTVNGKTNTYISLEVREKDLNNIYDELTAEQRIKIDTYVTLGMGFHLAKAVVKGEENLNTARDLDKRSAEQELAAADENPDERRKNNETRLISKDFIQAQLDEVLASNVEINSSIKRTFEYAINSIKDNKNLTVDQEKTLFAFIKHTYVSVDSYLEDEDINLPEGSSHYFKHVHDILKDLNRENLKKIYYKANLKLDTEGETKGVIDNFKEKQDKISPNEKLALIREIEKLGIDVNKLSEKGYTDDLTGDAKTLYEKSKNVKDLKQKLGSFQSSTVTKDYVKAYGKLQLTKKVLGKITKAANEGAVDDLESQFKILDGQDDTYQDRLRNPLQNHEDRFSQIQLNLLQKQGLNAAQDIGGLNFESLKAAEYPQSQKTNFTTKPPKGNPESLLNGREYNLKFLEDGHVIEMSKLFANKVQTDLNNPYVINVGQAATSAFEKSQQTKYLEGAMIKVKQGKAAQLFVSNNRHWTTCSLLPLPNNKFIIIGMDSEQQCDHIKTDIVPKLVDFGKKFGLEIERDGDKEFFNMSVMGQQQGACCGFASACNGFSLQKTYNELKLNNQNLMLKNGDSFDKDAFKNALLKNIVYRSDTITLEGNRSFTGTVLYENKESSIPLKDFVKQFGGLALQNIASNDAMKRHLGEDKVEYKQGNRAYPADKKEIEDILKNKELLGENTTVINEEIKIEYKGKNYAISQDELQQINNVKFYKGLDKLLNGGTLDSLLSDNRKKGIFIKILKDAFAGDKNPYTKEFVNNSEKLKNIVYIDNNIETKIKDVIKAASQEELNIEIGTWDAILLWLYHIPLLGRLVELFGAEVVKCAVEVDKLEDKLESWQKYTKISDSVQTLIAPAA